MLSHQPIMRKIAKSVAVEAMAPVPPVAGRGRITRDGYRAENHEWLNTLALDGVGRDPGKVDLKALSASGHPGYAHNGAARVVARMNEYGDREDRAKNVRLTGLREMYCFPCRPSEGFSDGPNNAGIRECATIDCPCWPYRLGFNPHNPRRGKNPFGHAQNGAARVVAR